MSALDRNIGYLLSSAERVRGNEEGKTDALAMTDLEKTYDQHRESVYFPSPYATSRIPAMHRDDVSMERDGCRSLHHHSNRQSEHMYDIPQQIRDDLRRHSYHMTSIQDSTIEISDYDTSKSRHLQSITEEGIPCDMDSFILHEKLAMSNMWAPNHRWRTNEVLPHEESYSPLHVHAQTFVTDAQQELSDAECDRDLRHMTENGIKVRNILQVGNRNICLAK